MRGYLCFGFSLMHGNLLQKMILVERVTYIYKLDVKSPLYTKSVHAQLNHMGPENYSSTPGTVLLLSSVILVRTGAD